MFFGFLCQVDAMAKKNLEPGVYLYKFTNYRGNYLRITSSYSQIPLNSYVSRKVGYVIFNNAISSIRLVGVSSIAVYTESNFRGNCETITRNIPNLNKTNVGNNSISSVKVNSRCSPSSPSVTLYDGKDFKGRSVTITGDVPDLRVSNFLNKTASLSLNKVRTIATFNKTHYQGKCQTFNKNYRSLAGTQIGLNSISSIKINSECDKYLILTVKNRSGLLIQVLFPTGLDPFMWGKPGSRRNRWEKGKKEIPSGSSLSFYIEPERTIKFSIKALMPIGDLAPLPEWKSVCNYEFLMGNNFTIIARGSYFKKMNCEKIQE